MAGMEVRNQVGRGLRGNLARLRDVLDATASQGIGSLARVAEHVGPADRHTHTLSSDNGMPVFSLHYPPRSCQAGERSCRPRTPASREDRPLPDNSGPIRAVPGPLDALTIPEDSAPKPTKAGLSKSILG